MTSTAGRVLRATAVALATTLTAALLPAGPAVAHVTVGGTIKTDTTWGRTSPAADGIYWVTSSVTINTGATLTLEPGVIVKLGSGESIVVGGTGGGTLVASGTATERITFTSIKDDLRADTNGDGTATAAAPGDWVRIQFSTGGGGALADVDVLYAGQSSNHAIYCSDGAPAELRNASVRRSRQIGLDCGSGRCPGVVVNSTFADNGTWPIRMYPSEASRIAADNEFTGNGNPGVYLAGQTLPAGAHAWAALAVPWFLASTLTVPAGATLDLAAGLVLKFDPGDGINVTGGELNTHGVPGQPVLLTSIKDDAALGDTNGDGTASLPARGDWSRIYYTGGGGALDGVEVRYAGYASSVAIQCEGGAPSRLAASTLRLNTGYALHCSTAGQCPATVTGNLFADNYGWPIRVYPSDAPRIAPDNAFAGNRYQGVYVQGTSVAAGTYAWPALPVPWYLASTLTLPAGATLDLAAGLVLKFDEGNGITVSGGALNTHGVAGQPVLFTSIRDDAALGDTNGDGTATVPARGNWSRIYYTSGGGGALDGVEVRYAGYASSVAIHCEGGAPSRLAASTVRLTSGIGLHCSTAGQCPASVSGNTFADNATWPIRLYPPDAPKIAADNVFVRNGNQGVDVYGTTVPAGTYAWAALAVPWHLTASLTIPAGASVDLAAGVVLKLNFGSSILVSGGTFSASGTAERMVLVTSERDDTALGDTNGDGTATTPAPGQWARIYYTGGGDAGTLAHAEFRYGGYASSVALHCSAGCFTALTGASIHDNTGTGVRVDWAGTSPTIARSTIRDNTRGIVVTGTASPVIGGAAGQGNNIHLNAAYGVENSGARCVNARFNFWGANDGPDDPSAANDACDIGSHAGSGDTVSDNVDYTGYVGSPSAPPEPPLPLSPPSPSESATNRPALTVQNSPSTGTLTYRFQVARNASFSDGLQDGSVDPGGAGTTSWTVPSALRENTTHYWRCRVEDQDSTLPSGWTETWRFFVSTVNDPPIAPNPKAPANGSRVATATPALVVVNASDPDDNELHDWPLTYAFEVFADADLTQLVDAQAGVAEGPAETSWTVATTLSENTEYWWRARAHDGTLDGAWGATRRFFVNAVNDAGPAAPALFAPVDGAILGTLQPALVVQNPVDPDRDALVFTFEVFTTPWLAGRVASTNSVAGPCCSGTTTWTVVPALERSRWHWWTSSARDAEISGPDMTPPGSFFTGGFPLPEPAELGYLPSASGDDARGDRVGYTTPGQPGDVFVAFEVFNVPAGSEADLRVLVNDAEIGTQGPACPDAWSSRRSVLVPDAAFLDGGTNRVHFTNALNAPGAPAIEWGVRNVRMDVPPPAGVAAWPWDTVVDVSWQPRDGVAGYNVYRATVSGGPYERRNASLVAGNLWRDLVLVNGTPYHYVVRSVGATGVEGSDSAEASATPSTEHGVTPVTDLRVTRAGDDVHLAWTDVTTTGGTLYYRVYSVGPASAPPFTRSGATVLGTPAGSPFDHAGAATGPTAYWYDVATVNSGGSEAGW